MGDELRAGVVGLGVMGRVHVLGLRKAGFSVVAVADPRPDIAAVAADLDVASIFSDPLELLRAGELDVLAIATPPDAHHPLAVAAARRGLHILCEKPMALDTKQAADMLETALHAGVIHVLNHQLRFNANRNLIRAKLRSGAIGRPLAVRYRGTYPSVRDQAWSWWSSRARGGGLLGEYGSHQIDLLRWWFGNVRAVEGSVATSVKTRRDPHTGDVRTVDSDDMASFRLTFASGVVAEIDLCGAVADSEPVRRLEIHGDEGAIVLDTDERLWIRPVGAHEEREITVAETDPSLIGDSRETYTQPFVRLARHFAAAIGGAPIPPMATFEDGLAIQRVLDAVRSGRPVILSQEDSDV